MERSVGTIREGSKDGRIVLDDVELWLEDTGSRWYGDFKLHLSELKKPAVKKIVELKRDAYYWLLLEDGRSGKMFIKSAKPSGESVSVRFMGTGPL